MFSRDLSFTCTPRIHLLIFHLLLKPAAYKEVNNVLTKLPSNLRHDHRRMCAFSYFRSRNKDVGHAIQSAVAENPMLHAHFAALCVIDAELLAMKFSHCAFLCGECTGWLSTFFAPVTLTLTRWPSYTNLTRIPRRYTGCENMNFVHQGFRKLSSDKQTDRQTDRENRPKQWTTPLCGWLIAMMTMFSSELTVLQ